MNAAAANKLEEMIRGANPVWVKEVTIREFPMVVTLVRERFERGSVFEVNEGGVGVRLANGDWLWVAGEDQPGGAR